MNQGNILSATEVSFKDFLFKNKRNRTILWLAAAAIVIQFAIFKYFYPFASYIHGDSFSYINAAYHNLSINTYLVGYSNFLRLFSVFTKSDLILTSFQYLLIQSSCLLLLFTIFYFYKSSKIVQVVLLAFMVLNPLFLHLGNLVSSDGLFLSLSLLWISLLLWIIHRPTNRIIMWHAVVLFIAFSTRYNAMIYPFLSAVAFALSPMTIFKKIKSMVVGVALCCLFIAFTTYKYKKLTGYWQYSPFSGWQMANNAMYAYRYVDSTERKLVPKKFQALDRMVRDFFDSTRDLKKFPSEAAMASSYYMWSPGMPLMNYRNRIFKKDTISGELKKWASMGPYYKAYGISIIKFYPWYYARYFLWPNANKYYAPPVEFLENYNSGKQDVTDQAKAWFGYKSRVIKPRWNNNAVWVLDFYPILSGIINIVMLCSLFCYLLLKGWRYSQTFKKAVLLGGMIWLFNAAFTILASSAALRFQSFPIVITTIFVVLLIEWLSKMASANSWIGNVKSETKTHEPELSVKALSH